MKTPHHADPPAPQAPEPTPEQLRFAADSADLAHVVRLLSGVLDNLVQNEARVTTAHDETLRAIIRQQAAAEKDYLAMLVAWLAARDPVLDAALRSQFTPDPPLDDVAAETTTDALLNAPAPVPLTSEGFTLTPAPPPLVPAPLPAPGAAPAAPAGSTPPKDKTLSLNLGAMRNIRG